MISAISGKKQAASPVAGKVKKISPEMLLRDAGKRPTDNVSEKMLRDMERDIAQMSASRTPGSIITGINQVAKESREKKEADFSARKAMNALKIMVDVIETLIVKPGHAATQIQAVDASRVMVEAVEKISSGLLSGLGLDPSSERNTVFLRTAMIAGSRIASEAWKAKDWGGEAIDVAPYIEALLVVAKADAPFSIMDDNQNPDAETALRMSTMNALTPLIMEMEIFDFLQNRDNVVKQAAALIVNQAISFANEISDDSIPSATRIMLTQNLINNGGKLYAASWRSHGEQTCSMLGAMSAEERSAFFRENRDGIPVEPINEIFLKSFSRLVSSVHALVLAPGQKLTNT